MAQSVYGCNLRPECTIHGSSGPKAFPTQRSSIVEAPAEKPSTSKLSSKHLPAAVKRINAFHDAVDLTGLNSLKASRRALKGKVTRLAGNFITIKKDLIDEEDPSVLEMALEDYTTAFAKYDAAADAVEAHPLAEPVDLDNDVIRILNTLRLDQLLTRGFRKDYDAQQVQAAAPAQANPPQAQALPANGNVNDHAPRFNAKRPPTLEQDIDVRKFAGWTPHWDNYYYLAKLNSQPQRTQVAAFWECCSPGFLKTIVHSIGIRHDTARPVEDIIEAIRMHLRSLRNPHIDMKDLLSVTQQPGQKYTSLKNNFLQLAEYAEAQDVTYDRLMIGLLLKAISNGEDKEKLVTQNHSTFDNAMTYLIGLETARETSKALTNPSKTAGIKEINATRSNYSHNKTNKPYKAPSANNDKQCKWCGKSPHNRKECPADGKECSKCKKIGHFASVCQSSKSRNRFSEIKPLNSVLVLHMGSSNSSRHHLNVNVSAKERNGTTVSATIKSRPDSGADISVIGLRNFNEANFGNLTMDPPLRDKIAAVDGSRIHQVGTFKADITVDGRHTKTTVVICSGISGFFIGLEDCKALDILSKHFPHPPPKTRTLFNIQTKKQDIKDEAFSAGILELRNTPRADGCSPAQTLFGRPLRSQIPCHWRSFTPKWQPKAEDAIEKRLENAAKAKMYYDRSTRVRKHLSAGDKVLVQDTSTKRWDKVATIVESGFRRYRITFPSGQTLWRNLKFLRKLPTTFETEDDDRPVKPTRILTTTQDAVIVTDENRSASTIINN
ncbi:Uncharacterized protein FKW44_021175 [Caligus rogercresseyi]|uniref:CCHC-type domain-containing protein n=1 Tax=Caligus rogercresseyi TaxID=217165 RepID=A0A7T8GRB3_CALRO|nr:Uncharacterized protein FKW44_021175 [Caligus rogercresseyi]